MSTSTLSPAAHAGWFAHRPLAVEFGILAGSVTVAPDGLASTVVVGDSRVHDGVRGRLAGLRRANALVLQIGTRASELEVDGYKPAVRGDPAAQLSELADGIAIGRSTY